MDSDADEDLVHREDADFLARFEAAAIPHEAWTHREHLCMAFLYLRRYQFERAIERMREGILRLNQAHGLVESQTRGYHHTITVAWARLVAGAIREQPSLTHTAAFIDQNPELGSSAVLGRHYSRELLASPLARQTFVEPDRLPLPEPMPSPPVS
jgi:hypothetical protein